MLQSVPMIICGSSYAHKETCSAGTPTALPTGQVNPSHAAPSCSAVPVALVGSQHQARHCPTLKRQMQKTILSSIQQSTIRFTGKVECTEDKTIQQMISKTSLLPPLDVCEIPPWRQPGNSIETTSSQFSSPCGCRTCQCFTSYHWTLLVIVMYFQVPVVIHPNAVGHRSQQIGWHRTYQHIFQKRSSRYSSNICFTCI